MSIGSYRIDLVVGDPNGKRLAIECDGERWHTPEQLQKDRDRQAILDRQGWRFVRIRGSVCFRDPESGMLPVLATLKDLGIDRDGAPFQRQWHRRRGRRARPTQRQGDPPSVASARTRRRPSLALHRCTARRAVVPPLSDSRELERRPRALARARAACFRLKMNQLRYSLPLLLLAACGGVGAQSDPSAGASLGTVEQSLGRDGCSVGYVIQNEFSDRYEVEVQVTNDGDAGDGWEVTWRFLGNERIINSFDARVVQNGAEVSATNLSSNGELGAGDSTQFGVTVLSSDAVLPAERECSIFR